MRLRGIGAFLALPLLLAALFVNSDIASAQEGAASGGPKAKPKLIEGKFGYAVKKPIVGAACPECPWGAMAEVVREAMKPYGWDIQICYYCAGSAREARLVSKAAIATPPNNPSPNDLPTPNGPIDFGITGTEYLRWAYDGTNDFAKDPGSPQRQLRAIAKIQEPTWFIVAVRSDQNIKSLADIVEKKMPVKMVATMGIGGLTTPTVLQYFGISEEVVKSFGGTFNTGYDRNREANVFVGFG